MTAPAKATDHATAGQRVSAELLNFTASYDQRQLEYHDATGGGIDKAVFARADLRAALAENDRLRAELATRTRERDEECERFARIASASAVLVSLGVRKRGFGDDALVEVRVGALLELQASLASPYGGQP